MESLMKYISRTSRLGILYRNDKMGKYGLNGYQNIYIQNICRTPGISQDQLAKMIFVNKSNVARQVALLEQNGFVTRTLSEQDKRQMQLYPTDKALELYPKIQKILQYWNSQLLEDFSIEEQEMLVSMMEKVMGKAIQLVEQTPEWDKENL